LQFSSDALEKGLFRSPTAHPAIPSSERICFVSPHSGSRRLHVREKTRLAPRRGHHEKTHPALPQMLGPIRQTGAEDVDVPAEERERALTTTGEAHDLQALDVHAARASIP
jgi:hypothetical protein